MLPLEIEYWLYKLFSNPIILVGICLAFLLLVFEKSLYFRSFRKNLFFSLITFVLLFLFFEAILNLGGFLYFYIYSNLDNPKIEEDTFRILFLGESTTEGGYAGLGNDYPAQVEKTLQFKYSEIKIRSYNQGIGGIETTAILRNLDRNMIKYGPHLVIIMAGNNNHCLRGNESFADVQQPSRLVRLYTNLKIHRLITFVEDIFLLSSSYKKGDFRYVQADENESFFKYPLPYYARKPYPQVSSTPKTISNLKNIIKIVRSYGSEIWFVGYLQPDAREDVNPVLQRIAEENNITYIGDYPLIDFKAWLTCYFHPDSKKKFNKMLQRFENVDLNGYYEHIEEFKDICSLFFDDNWHPSEEGHKIIAEKIAENIINKNLIGKLRKTD